MSVPIATVHEHYLSSTGEYNVGFTGQIVAVNAVSVSVLSEYATDVTLWSGVFTSDKRHHLATLALADSVHATLRRERLKAR